MEERVYCKNCGVSAKTIDSLTSTLCARHPDGPRKGNHELYEGSGKSRYYCKNCGTSAKTIALLTASACNKHPKGSLKGKHEPAL
jgi:hypothetical protein